MQTMKRFEAGTFLVCAALAVAGCSSATEPSTPTAELVSSSTSTPSAAPSGPAPDAGQVARMKAVADVYATRYQKVEADLHVAPTLCAAMPARGSRPLLKSESGDEWTHGKKVYYLFAANADAYKRDGGHEGTKQPDDQVLVKESYVAEEAPYDPKEEMIGEGSKFWKKGARASLFVMARHEGKWEFGTISPSGEVAVEGTATKACHDCHDKKPDGLFGLKQEP